MSSDATKILRVGMHGLRVILGYHDRLETAENCYAAASDRLGELMEVIEAVRPYVAAQRSDLLCTFSVASTGRLDTDECPGIEDEIVALTRFLQGTGDDPPDGYCAECLCREDWHRPGCSRRAPPEMPEPGEIVIKGKDER